jgi:hypothetical protein
MTENSPFKGPFIEEKFDNSKGFYTRIFSSVSDRSILIKELTRLRPIKGLVENYNKKTFYEDVLSTHNLLLSQQYGLSKFIPSTQLVWGKNAEGIERGFILMKRVSGKEIWNIYDIERPIAKQLDELISKSLEMGRENLDMNLGVRKIPDILDGFGFINIVVGKTDPNGPTRPYFIDTYPIKTRRDYDKKIWELAVRDLSLKSKGYPFERTRKSIKNFFNGSTLLW